VARRVPLTNTSLISLDAETLALDCSEPTASHKECVLRINALEPHLQTQFRVRGDVLRSELLSVAVKTIQQRQALLSGSSAKRISEKKLYFHYFLLLCTLARVPAGAFLFNLI